MKKLLLSLIFCLAVSLFFVAPVQAASCPSGYNCSGGCTSVGQCVNNKTCRVIRDNDGNDNIVPEGDGCGSSQLGSVEPPGKIAALNSLAGGTYGNNIGLLIFVSRLIHLFAIICGMWAMFNFLYSGYILIMNQYETKAQQEVKDKITMTVIGLVIIASTYTIAGIIGLVFFGNAAYLLMPTLIGATQ